MKILVTGAAGFIGTKLSHVLAKRGDLVVGLDNINDYYDVRLKYARLKQNGFDLDPNDEYWGEMIRSSLFSNYQFIRLNLEDKEQLENLFETEKFDKVINLAAQAGVRYSITNPYAYLNSNLVGFLNILECVRNYHVPYLVYASSSSVYGMNEKVPFSEDDKTDTPVSLYAATKKANELMAHAYSKLYQIPTVGLRYFTVYGPWGRPDMAPMIFTKAISAEAPIQIFNNGNLSRDFTYIDDIVEGTVRVIDKVLQGNDETVPYKIYNIGCYNPVRLMDFIHELESALEKKAIKTYLPMQQGDVYQTYADVNKLDEEIGYKPVVSLHEGIGRFVEWYKSEQNPLK
jgi:UDP-glucuronate 4-epimerase